MELRDYQIKLAADARAKLRELIKANKRKNIVIQAATGSGKTVVAASLLHAAEQKDSMSLFFAHRRELIYQCAKKLETFGVNHGIIMSGEHMDSWARTQVCSIDTFRARAINGRMKWPDAKLVIIDECHRSLSPTYLKVIEHYEAAGAVIIGLSATPKRADGKGLARYYDGIVCAPSVAELTKMGHLVPAKYFAPSVPDLTGIRTVQGDYDPKQLEEAMDRQELVGDVVTNWMRIAKDRQTVVFASGVAHSIHLAKEFERMGVKAAHVDGYTPEAERDEIIKQLRAKKIQVICNCMVFTEGFDEPSLSCVVLARPTKQHTMYMQMAGRGLRPDANKTDCLILDHAGALYRHGMVADPYTWALEEGKEAETEVARRQRVREKTIITCENCDAIYSGQINCPECNHIPVRVGRYVKSKNGELVAVIDAQHPPPNPHDWRRSDRVQWFNMFRLYAATKKPNPYKRGWCYQAFKEKFGEWPPKDYPELDYDKIEITPEFMSHIRGKHLQRMYALRAQERKEQERFEREGIRFEGVLPS